MGLIVVLLIITVLGVVIQKFLKNIVKILEDDKKDFR